MNDWYENGDIYVLADTETDVVVEDLLGLVPREPTPSCITPWKVPDSSNPPALSPGTSPSESPDNLHLPDPSPPLPDRQVLNSDARIELLHRVEKSFDEEMLNLSLKATGSTDYALQDKRDVSRDVTNTSLLEGLNDEGEMTFACHQNSINSNIIALQDRKNYKAYGMAALPVKKSLF